MHDVSDIHVTQAPAAFLGVSYPSAQSAVCCVAFAATAIPPPSQLGELDKKMSHFGTVLSCVPPNNSVLNRWQLPEV